MAVRRRPRPQTSVTPGGPFAQDELALDLLVPAAAGTNGNGSGDGNPVALKRLVPVAVTWLRRRGDRVRKDQELATVRCRLGEAEVTRKLLSPRTGTLEEALTPALPPPRGRRRGPAAAGAGQGGVLHASVPAGRPDVRGVRGGGPGPGQRAPRRGRDHAGVCPRRAPRVGQQGGLVWSGWFWFWSKCWSRW
jgi:hypothetical protein